MRKVIFTLGFMVTFCAVNAQVLYSTTVHGGSNYNGAIVKLVTATNSLTAAYSFGDTDGALPYGSLLLASDGKLYGMTSAGGTSGYGVIFSYNPSSGIYTKLLDFDGTNGRNPRGSLIQASDGKLYGMTSQGGTGSVGVIFSYDPSNGAYAKLVDFDYYTGGGAPQGSLIQASDGKLYGMTSAGGISGYGVTFSYDPSTAIYAKLFDFDGYDGRTPHGSFIQDSNGKLYGMTQHGGFLENGVIFSYDPSTATHEVVETFEALTGGAQPYGSLMEASDGILYGMTQRGGSSSYGVIFPYVLDYSNAPYYPQVISFDFTKGGLPQGNLMQASNGKLYGMTSGGGIAGTVNGLGGAFSYDPSTSTYIKLVDFNGSNGADPGYNSFTEVPCATTTWYRDADGDGFGDATGNVQLCDPQTGYVADNTDCNDADAGVHTPITYYGDADGDGFGNAALTIAYPSSTPPAGYVTDSTDCDDTKLLYTDNDGDGYGTGSPVACGAADNTDSDDSDAGVHLPITYYRDNDGDGFGNPAAAITIPSSSPPAGYVVNSADCNDADINIHPVTYYRDADGDGFGDPLVTFTLCLPTSIPGYVTNNLDCDDTEKLYADNDSDGYGAGAPVTCGIADNTDCNDADATVHPVTYYRDADGDGLGNATIAITACSSSPPTGYAASNTDCNDAEINTTETLYRDADGDGYGNAAISITVTTSTSVPGYVINSLDCNDNNAAVHPGAVEICGNGIDDNCNGQVDEGCTAGSVQIALADKSIREGNTGSKLMPFIVYLNKKSLKTVTVKYTTQDDAAMAGSDYIAQSGTITFLPGVNTTTVNIRINGDKMPEANETFRIVLSNPVNAVIAGGTGVGTIINDDVAAMTAAKDDGLAQKQGFTVKVWPNPAKDFLNVQLTGINEDNITLQLQDIQGRVLKEEKINGFQKITQQQMNISGVANGVYLLEIIGESGIIHTEKIVIQK